MACFLIVSTSEHFLPREATIPPQESGVHSLVCLDFLTAYFASQIPRLIKSEAPLGGGGVLAHSALWGSRLLLKGQRVSRTEFVEVASFPSILTFKKSTPRKRRNT